MRRRHGGASDVRCHQGTTAAPQSDPHSRLILGAQGTVFDVSGSAAYAAGGKYHGSFPSSVSNRGLGADDGPPAVFTGKDASRALGKMSLEEKDCVAEWEDLDDKEKKVLDDWFTFFSKRYSIVGVVERETSSL
jgi:membrane-associated progesterone receptor component